MKKYGEDTTNSKVEVLKEEEAKKKVKQARLELQKQASSDNKEKEG